jgi:hypothetical protein
MSSAIKDAELSLFDFLGILITYLSADGPRLGSIRFFEAHLPFPLSKAQDGIPGIPVEVRNLYRPMGWGSNAEGYRPDPQRPMGSCNIVRCPLQPPRGNGG